MALSLGVLLLLLFATMAPAHASTSTETVTIPSTETDFAQQVEVAQFDPSLGVLQSVTLELGADVEGLMQIENLSDSSSSTGDVTLAATVTIASVADPTVTIAPALPSDTEVFDLEIFDGTIDYAGPSGMTFDDLQGSDAVSAIFTDPADLAVFTGTGTTAFDVEAIATSAANATGGNIELVFTTLAAAEIVVTYEYLAPGIEIQKTPNQQVVVFGGDATFTIDVTNTGEIDLVDVVVVDPLTPDCDIEIPTLAVGETVTYECTATTVTEDFTNVASISGGALDGPIAEDDDDAVVDVLVPDIQVIKSPDQQTIGFGADATFTIDVTNTGDVDLFDVVVADRLAPDCVAEIGDLPVGTTFSYECAASAVTEDFTNVARVSGEDEQGNVVNDRDSADVDVLVPEIAIEKTPDLRSVLPGHDAPFTITVTNTGDVDLFDVVVTDAQVPGCEASIGDLAVGESTSYDCVAVGVTSPFTNIADVVGVDAEGNQVTDSDDAQVVIGLPETGSDAVELSIAGLIMLLAGGALVVYERRRATP